jgi:tetratricopeptide (TPR) repeat protein
MINIKLLSDKRKGHQAKIEGLENHQQMVPEKNQGFIRYNVDEAQRVTEARGAWEREETGDLEEIQESDESLLADTLHDKGYQARQSGDFQKAVQYYTKALSIRPDHYKVFAC